MMLDAWSPLFNRYTESEPPDFQVFLANFPHCLPEHYQYLELSLFQLGNITLEDVRSTIMDLKHLPTALTPSVYMN